jgi:hypothetical protein
MIHVKTAINLGIGGEMAFCWQRAGAGDASSGRRTIG